MKFETIEDYDNYLNGIRADLEEIEEIIKKHPESSGTKGNYETLKYVYDIYENNRKEFIQTLNEINLNLYGNKITKSLPLNNIYLLGRKFNNTKNSASNLLEVNFIPEDILIEEISKGSYNIRFSFPNPTEEDVKRKSPRKKGLLKIFDFINCGDDIEKLKNEADSNGKEALRNYKEFIYEIVRNNANFTLDTEKGTLKAGLTLEQCKNICENLNV